MKRVEEKRARESARYVERALAVLRAEREAREAKERARCPPLSDEQATRMLEALVAGEREQKIEEAPQPAGASAGRPA